MRPLILIFLLLLTITSKAQLPNYIPILVGDKYGFCDSTMKMLVEPEWDEVLYYQGKNYLIKKEGKQYYLNNENGAITIGYDSIVDVFSTQETYNYSQYFKGGLRNDSLFIFYGIPDTTILKIPLKFPTEYNSRIYVLDSAKNIFFVNHYPWNNYSTNCLYKSFFTKNKTKPYSQIISPKGILYQSDSASPLGNGYFTDTKNNEKALFRIMNDSMVRLTNYEYDYFIPPDSFGIIKALKPPITIEGTGIVLKGWRRNKIRTIKTKGTRYEDFYFLDSLGREVFRLPGAYPYPYSAGIADMTGLDKNLLIFPEYQQNSTRYSILLKDTLKNSWEGIYNPNNHQPFSLVEKIGSYYIIYKYFGFWLKERLIDNSGRNLLGRDYNRLTKYNDTLLLFEDSLSAGIVKTNGIIVLRSPNIDSLKWSISGGKYNFITLYGQNYKTSEYRSYTYTWGNEGLTFIDSSLAMAIYNKYQKIENDSLKTTGDKYWQLASKKTKEVTIDKYADNWRIEVYCDSLLINPSLDIIDVDNRYDVLFVMKSRMGHTWIIDNNGKIVYNTDGDYEYDVQYKTAGKINHFVITITDKKRKFIANIHWPGFAGQPYYTNMPIERFIDSFTVVKKSPKSKMVGLLDKNNRLIIPPMYSEIIGKKSIGNGSYLFMTNGYSEYKTFPFPHSLLYSTGKIYDGKGNEIFDDLHSSFYPFQHFSPLYGVTFNDNGIYRTIFIDHYNTIYKK